MGMQVVCPGIEQGMACDGMAGLTSNVWGTESGIDTRQFDIGWQEGLQMGCQALSRSLPSVGIDDQ
jgi:hypothetical protein